MKLFGTDGIRGKYGAFPLDDSTIRRIGSALSKTYSKKINKFFIAHDGRSSHLKICKNATSCHGKKCIKHISEHITHVKIR